MIYISKIEISHFRSINELTIDEISDVNVISGANDIGKSNILKALNLFFNYEDSPVNLEEDTNTFHAYFSKHARKRKFIAVKLTFRRPRGKYIDSLTDYFWVKRQWDSYHPVEPETTWGRDGESQAEEEWKQGLTWFLKKSRFLYVPAIRDRSYFQQVLGKIYREITERRDEELKSAGDSLLGVIESRSTQLRAALMDATGLEFTFELPDNVFALLKAAGLYTDHSIPYYLRGDGIQALTVPGLLQSLSELNKTYYYIWGFEEPENSLEYKKATALADLIRDSYSKQAQIFLTTHSPAFLAMENAKTSIFRVSRREQKYERKQYVEQVTDIQPVFVRGDFRENLLPKDLGLLKLARQFDRDYRAKEEYELKIDSLEEEINHLTRPILIVEGPHDCKTLKAVWERIIPHMMPFEIIPAGDAGKITALLTQVIRINRQRIFALYDHDKEGINRIRNLGKGNPQFIETQCETYRHFSYGELVVAQTLIPPLGREDQANNMNLTLEFYFPDSVLYELDNVPGCQLFSTKTYIDAGQPKHLDRERLQTLIDAGDVSTVHRQIDGPGKSHLSAKVLDLNTHELEPFCRLLFEITNHLVKDFAEEFAHEFEPSDL